MSVKTEFWNGNMAAARATQRARVQVIAAYPITPQTHTVEYLSQFVADGDLDAQMVKVESEHSALSACCGAAGVGARSFTASCSQGLQLMSEVMYFASGMRFPIVMAIANRTLSVPVNIWADHQDSLVNRDAGWIQLYAGDVQEVYDLMLLAYRVAEDPRVYLPAMVCYDGFILSHASEPVDPITQEQADRFLRPPGVTERAILDTQNPQQFGEVLFPDFYPDYEFKKHTALNIALDVMREAMDEYAEVSGRQLEPVEGWFLDDAEYVFVGIGSMMQTARYAAQQMRARGEKVGVLALRVFRPFPENEIRRALRGVRMVLVMDRDIGYGSSGMVYPDVTRALYHAADRPRALNFIIGTGGKDITPTTLERCLEIAVGAEASALAAGEQTAGEQMADAQTVFWPDARGPAEGIAYTAAPDAGAAPERN